MWGYTRSVPHTLGRYELVRELGRGGMAEVFLARRRGPSGVDKQLAIKRIRRERASDPRLLSMFVDEARLSMAMVHKNIVPMFDFGRVGDELFLVMEYVDGADLGAALDGAGRSSCPPPPEVVAYIAMEACQALDYAHTMSNQSGKRAVVHRDVNPRNVLLSYAGEVKLADFGVAITETDLGEAGRVRGTPAYMAPEQARAQSVDGRADVFSVGLVLWEALAGRRAYGSGSVKEILAVARTGEVPPLPEGVPTPLARIVDKATARDLDARYASARDLQLDLDEYLVAARASDPGGAPLDHRLTTWLEKVCPAGAGESARPQLAETPAGQVVTYLEHGEVRLERALATGAGETTQRSIAETVAEDESVGDPPSDAALASGRARRLVVGVIAVGFAALVAALVYGWVREPGSAAPTGVAESRIGLESDAAIDKSRPADAAPLDNGDGGPSNDAAVEAAPTAVRGPAVERVEPTPDKPPRPRKDAGDAAPAGIVRVSSAPWAIVKVVGRRAGCAETPCEISLPPGLHTLHLRNPHAGLEKTLQVQVTSGKTTDLVESLTRK